MEDQYCDLCEEEIRYGDVVHFVQTDNGELNIVHHRCDTNTVVYYTLKVLGLLNPFPLFPVPQNGEGDKR